jgi:hypothetical protein
MGELALTEGGVPENEPLPIGIDLIAVHMVDDELSARNDVRKTDRPVARAQAIEVADVDGSFLVRL